MTFDIITTLALISSIILIWFQRKSIMSLEQEVWQLEQDYKNDTGKVYRRKGRIFESWNLTENTKG
jgi:hypothetical protein